MNYIRPCKNVIDMPLTKDMCGIYSSNPMPSCHYTALLQVGAHN